MPLILPSQRVIRPNPLAYPAGAVPGIDLSHPAAAGLRFSAVSGGASAFSIYPNFKVPTLPFGMISGIDRSLGPFFRATGGSGYSFSGQSAANDTTFTVGLFCIFKTLGSTSERCLNTSSDDGTNGWQFGTASGGLILYLCPTSAVASATISTSGLSNNVPYFIAASCLGKSPATTTYVIKNLLTGQVVSQTVTSAGSDPTTPTGTYVVGSSSGFDCGPIAAVMASSTAMSAQQLLAWAKSPWEFWYPNRTIQYTTPATTTTTTGGARIRQRWNRSPLAYPAGAVPGVDPSHVASQQLIMSAVVSGGANYVNLVTGLPFTNSGGTGSVTVAIKDKIGPSLFINNTYNPLAASPSEFITSFTYAGTVHLPTALTSGYNALGSLGSALNIYVKSFALCLEMSTDDFSSFTLTPGHSYFFAVSIRDCTTVGSTINFLALDLGTGQIFTSTIVSTGLKTSAIDNAIVVGNDRAGDPSNMNIATAAYNRRFMSIAQLLAWSADPWAFWYPNKTINLSSSAASVGGGGFLAAWARWINLPVIGTGNY